MGEAKNIYFTCLNFVNSFSLFVRFIPIVFNSCLRTFYTETNQNA